MSGVHVQARVAARGLDFDVDFPAGLTSVVVGPNGAGKSSLLQLIGGGLRPSSGTVRIADRIVAGDGAWTPPHCRQVATLTQRALLFPHLSVLENVAYGPRAAGASKAAAHARARAELEQVDAMQFAERRPAQLSGGQAQRVAIARALACDPKVLLLDEPFAAIDVEQAASLRALLAGRLTGRTTILVSHDLYDISALGDQLFVIEDGMLAAAGEPAKLLASPETAFLAKLAGVNRLLGKAIDDQTLRVGSQQIVGLAESLSAGQDAMAIFEPAAVALHQRPPEGSARNVWPVQIVGMQRLGPIVRVELQLTDSQRFSADLTPQSSTIFATTGAELYASVKAVQVKLLPIGSAASKMSATPPRVVPTTRDS